MPGLTATGLGSGLDINSLVDQLVAAERAPTNNRLNLREARANAQLSALGKLKSALSGFRSALTALKSADRFQGRSVTSTNADIVSATATSSAVPGTYTVEVLTRTTSHKLASAAFADAETHIGSGTLTIAIGDESMALEFGEEGTTLTAIRDAINAADDNPGVAATIVTADDGARLILSATGSGTASEMTLAVSGGDDGLLPFVYDGEAPPNAMTELQAASDATLRIDNFDVTSTSNDIDSAIEGVTLSLKKAEPGTTVTVTVTHDKDSSRNAIVSFVGAYNTLLDTIREVTAYNAEKREAAALMGDPAVRGFSDGLRREVSSSTEGATLKSLSMLGVTTESNGKLKIDTAQLDALMASDFDSIGDFFAGDAGLASRLDAVVDNILKTSGAIATRESTLQDNLKSISEQREMLDRRLESVRKRLSAQFNAMDRLLSQLRNTSDYLAAQLTPPTS